MVEITPPDHLAAFRWRVLDWAAKGYVRLVHVIWDAHLFGSGPRLSEALAMAEDLVTSLLGREYVQLVPGTGGHPVPSGEAAAY
jgi:hypothetical protein